jgi:hypothetical protein
MEAFSFTNSISKAQYTRYFLQLELMKPRRIVMYVCGIVMLFGAVMGLAFPDSWFGVTRLVSLEFALPVLIVLLIIALRAKVRTAYEGQRRLLVDVHFTVSDEGISADAPGIASSYQWAAIERSLETKDMLLLYITKRSAVLINKAAVSEAQLAAIRGHIPASQKG